MSRAHEAASADIFSISDELLAERLQFIEEIGYGNWGSVWLCRPKHGPEHDARLHEDRIAVKLVHRSRTTTTAARVRSLWNEMKVVRALKHEPHPSIIPFYSFIITPSYALITMQYHPGLVPVEVPESHAKPWFRSLLSGVEFLHKRGVVHNDIKPANILMSRENVPVLVDFGFAERYEPGGSKAFQSNLSYGTPEYLSPERARGLPHDTRKADVWSLGVTFFEILTGRTPFEHADGEQFTTKDDLERYWDRTVRGKWVGSWTMSRALERLLRRMVLPNADLRCMAHEAADDAYWAREDAPSPSHRRAASAAHGGTHAGPVFATQRSKDTFRLADIFAQLTPRSSPEKAKARERRRERHRADKDKDKENTPTKKRAPEDSGGSPPRPHAGHGRSHSQPKLLFTASEGTGTAKKTVVPAFLASFSPAKYTPRASTSASKTLKENADPPATPVTPTAATAAPATPQTAPAECKTARSTRRPLGPRSPTPPSSPRAPLQALAHKENASTPALLLAPAPAPEGDGDGDGDGDGRRASAERDADGGVATFPRRRAHEGPRAGGSNASSVRERMRDWERERARLRQMALDLSDEGASGSGSGSEKEVVEEQAEAERAEAEQMQMRMQEGPEDDVKRRREGDSKEDQPVIEKVADSAQRDRGKRISGLTIVTASSRTITDSSLPPTPLWPLVEESVSADPASEQARCGNGSGLSILKQSFKMSLDKTMRLCKSSTMALGRSTPALTFSHGTDDDESRASISEQASWVEDETAHKANAPERVGRHATRSEEVAPVNDVDRMTLWIRDVEKVVEDARQSFAASTNGPCEVPPLPVAPTSRRVSPHYRPPRTARKIVHASEIFASESQSGVDRTSSYASQIDSAMDASAISASTSKLPVAPPEPAISSTAESELPIKPQTSSRPRRATVLTCSPEGTQSMSLEEAAGCGSSTKRREKSKSQGDLLNPIPRPITPVSQLELELGKLAMPAHPKRLSSLVDRSLFISSPLPSPREKSSDQSQDELTAPPLFVEPYPPRPQSAHLACTLDTASRKHLEDVYDRFLMSTAGVKRVGRGYQSNNSRPASGIPVYTAKRSLGFFGPTRRPMPPPVSSDDPSKDPSIDDFGIMMHSTPHDRSNSQDESKNTVAIVRKAIKAIVSGKPMTTRSKVVAV